MTTGIVESFEQAEIFVTGGSGVVGKALIEKLLRSCNVKTIYILLRPKRGLSVTERLEKFRKNKIFEKLNSTKPEKLERLIAVPGDIQFDMLGITPEYGELMQHVSLVYHCAATVRFDEPLERAIDLNIGGTLRALTFAETLKKLKLFVHISTFYSNPYLEFVEPKVYPPPLDWRLCLKLAKDIDCEGAVRYLTKKIITGFPNTYCFTKNIAESLVNDYRDRLPVAIFRPSIVIFSLEEPVPGFSPSIIGAMGLFLGSGAGVLKCVHMNNQTLDVMPQDCMINALAYYTKYAVERYENEKKLETTPVIMVSSAKYMKQTMPEMSAMLNCLWPFAAFEKAVLLPGCHFTNKTSVYMARVFIQQVFPAILIDGLLRLFGQKPVLMQIQRKAVVSQHELRAFMFNKFDSEGTSLEDNLFKETEGTPFDLTKSIKFAENKYLVGIHMLNMLLQMRANLMKEDQSTIPRAQRILAIKQFIYNGFQYYLGYTVCRKLLAHSSDIIEYIIHSLTGRITT